MSIEIPTISISEDDIRYNFEKYEKFCDSLTDKIQEIRNERNIVILTEEFDQYFKEKIDATKKRALKKTEWIFVENIRKGNVAPDDIKCCQEYCYFNDNSNRLNYYKGYHRLKGKTICLCSEDFEDFEEIDKNELVDEFRGKKMTVKQMVDFLNN